MLVRWLFIDAGSPKSRLERARLPLEASAVSVEVDGTSAISLISHHRRSRVSLAEASRAFDLPTGRRAMFVPACF